MEELKKDEVSTSEKTDTKPEVGGAEKTLIDLLNENPKLQSEFDKLNAKSLETAKSKWVEDAEAKKTEAEKLAKMDSDEKHKYELQKEKDRADKAESEANALKLEKEAIKIAKEKDVDISLLEMIDYSKENAESIKTKIEEIANIYKKAVENGINKKFQEKTPTTKTDDTTAKKNVSRSSY